jgi:two-component sensor histidine kinase
VSEDRLLTSRGERVVRWTRTALFDESGQPIECIGIGHDITRERDSTRQLEAALAEQQTLLRELHHRVKNNLQIIASMIGMRCSDVEDPTVHRMVRDMESRIQAMAVIHESLYRAPDLVHVDAVALLGGLIEAIRRAHADAPATFQVDIQPLELNFDDALAIGRVAHELVSNALVHAFSDGRRGSIGIRLSARLGELCIDVEDDGVGLPPGFSIGRLRTLGLRIVEGIVQHRRGSLRLENRHGTIAAVRLPAVTPAKKGDE